jgi:Zn-dependent M28 family amino/carboxypeptidase
VKNIIGVLEGEGPLADETIIVGAHYDHLGLGGYGSLAPWTSAIHNGADDNASGTSTLLEIARRLAASEKKPHRRIVFIAFSGEERGLLGSAHYVRQPRYPLEKTIAMFNLDMVGRLREDKLTVFGTATAKNFDSLVGEACQQAGIHLIKFEGAMGRDQLSSDHVSFYNRKIPALHFFTGTHTDYHRPSDDADKLNVVGMRRIADVVVKVVETTDAEVERPQYVEVKQSGSGGVRGVSLGTMPDYSAQVEGVALAGVRPGSPADQAGMKAGDILIQLGDSRIGNIDDFMNALGKHKPGEEVPITVKREGKDVKLKATLAPSSGR